MSYIDEAQVEIVTVDYFRAYRGHIGHIGGHTTYFS
jgi:hypothetical protein